MSEDLDELLAGVTGSVLAAIAENPYVTERELKEGVDADEQSVEAAVERLQTTDAVVSLTRGGDSELESRVPQQAYVLNPEQEEAIRSALAGDEDD